MQQTEVMFFFDTEDFTCDLSQDAAKKLAEICTEEGVTGHFSVVGLVAQLLRDTGRTDVIEALKKHEIGTHTWSHSVHPTICEMADCEDFHAANERVIEAEGRAISVLRSVFDLQEILFAVPPGNSHSYPAMYYYAASGIPFNCGTYVFDDQRTETRFANAIHVSYDICVEEVAFGGSVEEALDQYAGKKRIIIYTHPNMAYFSEFWDKYNFEGANLHEDGDYAMPPRRTVEETRHYFDTFRAFVRAAKADPRFRVTSLREILAGETAPEPITPADIPAIRAALLRDYAPIPERKLRLYDIFMAAANFLTGAEEYRPGTAYGLLYAPEEIASPVELTVRGIREAAAQLPKNTFLPHSVMVDGQKIGTGDMLYAMLAALEAKGDTITLPPHPEMTFLRRYPDLMNMSLRGTWMHSPDFRDAYLSDRMRLQAYTIR